MKAENPPPWLAAQVDRDLTDPGPARSVWWCPRCEVGGCDPDPTCWCCGDHRTAVLGMSRLGFAPSQDQFLSWRLSQPAA